MKRWVAEYLDYSIRYYAYYHDMDDKEVRAEVLAMMSALHDLYCGKEG